MKPKKIKKPTEAQYRKEELQMALDYAPTIYACAECGWPVISGYCCNTCGNTDPRNPKDDET